MTFLVALNVLRHLRNLVAASYVCPPVHGSYLVCEMDGYLQELLHESRSNIKR